MKLSESEEQLRRESPAYRSDDAWDVLEPQAMEVVLSVRFDPRSARRIATLARQASRTPSALIREWTLDRLASAGWVGTDAANGVREERASYAADVDFEGLRERYRPRRIRLLLIGESRPAGGTFFYLANSNLFSATRDAFVAARGSAPQGAQFLEQLRREGIWLYDLAPYPVNRLNGRPRRDAVEERVAELVDLLREAKPNTVVAIKRTLEPAVRTAVLSAGLDLERLHVLPFPLYQYRKEFVGRLAVLFREKGAPRRTTEPRRARRAVAHAEVAHPVGATQRITENDIEKGQIRIPQAFKRLLPDGRSRLSVDLRGRTFVTSYDPRHGPDRSRSGVLRVPRGVLIETVEPNEHLTLAVAGDVVTLR